ncbi:MAG TPA: amidohydrolase family protein [Candidatus Sulfotelmatobacter sp.]|nr:amidohydrolase family protein [Candidatus Sulfotelmatobacter sp.]
MKIKSGPQKGMSRRQLLQAGLATAATVVVGGNAAGEVSNQVAQPPEVRVIDIHAHYFPQVYLDLVATEGKRFDAGYHMTDKGWYIKTPAGNNGPLPAKFIDLKARIADMDQQGVAVQAISLTAPMLYWCDSNLSTKLAVAWNDAASAAHQTYPTRLVAFLTLPMLYPDTALPELERAHKLPGMRGVYLGTNIAGRELDDPLFEPILARIEALDLPVFLHPVDVAGQDRLKSFFLSNLIGNPVDTAIAACHLIFGGVLDRHPKLQICLPHGGGVLPILVGRIDQGWRVRDELKGLSKAPSDYLQRFTYDTITHSKPVMEFVINQVGPERIMVGSDYCFTMGYNRPVQFVNQVDLTSSQRRMILGGNAERILQLQS